MAAHRLPEVTVVADAGMLSEANLAALEDAGLRFIVGARIPEVPYQVTEWRRRHPDQPISDGQIFTQPSIMGGKADPRRRMIFYQYRADRARRTLKGIDQQIVKAEKAVAGQAAVKRNRFVQLTGGSRSINRDLEAKTRALAGLKGYVTNLEAPTPELVMGAYHQLWQIEKSFRMSKTDLRARPIYHHKRDPIEAHLTVVMAALAVSRMVERSTTWSIARFVKTLRRYHTVTIQAGDQTITAADPLPSDAQQALARLRDAAAGHYLAQVRSHQRRFPGRSALHAAGECTGRCIHRLRAGSARPWSERPARRSVRHRPGVRGHGRALTRVWRGVLVRSQFGRADRPARGPDFAAGNQASGLRAAPFGARLHLFGVAR
jgi:Transposase DDE domain